MVGTRRRAGRRGHADPSLANKTPLINYTAVGDGFDVVLTCDRVVQIHGVLAGQLVDFDGSVLSQINSLSADNPFTLRVSLDIEPVNGQRLRLAVNDPAVRAFDGSFIRPGETIITV